MSITKPPLAAPVPGGREWLERRTEDVLTLAYRQACDAVRIGVILQDVKKEVGHGQFTEWVAERLPFSAQHARRLMQVAKVFKSYQTAHFEKFEPSALYVLAQTTGVKPEVREHAVQLAEAGERITRARALELIDAHKPVADLSRGELARYDRERREMDKRVVVDRDGQPKLDKDGAVMKADADAETERLEARDRDERLATGELLQQALKRFSRLELKHVEDAEDGGDDQELMFQVTGYPVEPDARVVVKSHADPRILLELLLEVKRTKHCNGGCCPTPLDVIPIAEFNRNRKQPDGRNPRCRSCEKKRKAEDRAKRKQQGAE